MKVYTKEEKIRITEQFLASEGWEWYKQELDSQLKYFEPTIFQSVDVNDRIFKDGVLAGIRHCINLPKNVNKENDSFVRRIYESLSGGTKNGSL